MATEGHVTALQSGNVRLHQRGKAAKLREVYEWWAVQVDKTGQGCTHPATWKRA